MNYAFIIPKPLVCMRARACACVRICVGGSIFVHSGAGWYFGNVHACACLKHFFGADVYFSFFFTIKCLKSIQILKKKMLVCGCACGCVRRTLPKCVQCLCGVRPKIAHTKGLIIPQ